MVVPVWDRPSVVWSRETRVYSLPGSCDTKSRTSEVRPVLPLRILALTLSCPGDRDGGGGWANDMIGPSSSDPLERPW